MPLEGDLRRVVEIAGAAATVGFVVWQCVMKRSLSDAPRMTASLLLQQDAETSNAIIALLRRDTGFQRLSEQEGSDIIKRDQEDDEKLDKGIQLSISRGVLQKIPPPKVTKINVIGLTPQDVVEKICSTGAGGEGGCIIVLQGMSGTGKGTTAAELLKKMPRSYAWSNGNVFRSLTLLAVSEYGDRVKAEAAAVMTPENVAKWMGKLQFKQTEAGSKGAAPKYDIFIAVNGQNLRVSEIQNTKLKEPSVGKAIPSVAEYTQGDVVKFASAALQQMVDDGMNIVLEGRGPTVQYVPTRYRFELVINDTKLLGQRRAAQRIAAKARGGLSGGTGPHADLEGSPKAPVPANCDVSSLVRTACHLLVSERDQSRTAGKM